ncbi:MAG: PIG-L family deacetylase, partial [Pseudomonadota bacterium]
MNLFLLPHQDDEYGVFPILERLAAKQEKVAVAYLTTGTLDGSHCPRRNDESLGVLKNLGVDSAEVIFIGESEGIPDSQLWRHADRAAAALLATFKRVNQVSRIYTPAWEGGHQDHDAAYIIACYLAQEYRCLERSRQFPLYNGRGLPGAM